jgi:hypothetical protein
MPKSEHDTNPSVPIALHRESAVEPLVRRPTERGLGGSSRPPPPPHAVPASTPVGAKKDSVEVLLDGIDAPPERTRQTPQSAGQASAAYHVEHAVRPARTTPDAEPKVVVATSPMPATLRLDRARVEALALRAEAQAYAQPRVSRAADTDDATAFPAPSRVSVPLRSAIALVAGLAVVAAIFAVVLKRTGGEDAGVMEPAVTAAAAAAPLAAPSPAPAAASATAPAMAAVPPPAPEPVAATETASAAAPPPSPAPTPPPAATVAAATATAPPRPAGSAKPRPRPTAAPDLGEFKTTFH